MKTIVIGDVHGCYNELKDLFMSLVENGEYNKDTDKIVFLGDYIDRGDDSRLVIQFIRNIQKTHNNVIALMGNHEDMLLNYYDGYDNNWLYNGYSDTFASYTGYSKEFDDDVEWMRTLPLYHEDEHFIYVHAGIDVDRNMDEQDKYTMLWIREEFIYNPKKYNKPVIFGHTPTMNLNGDNVPTYTFANHIALDTGCVYGGALSALVIEDGNVTGFYQVDKEPNVIEEK